MKITLEVVDTPNPKKPVVRQAAVKIAASELARVHLHLSFPEKRNRTRLYIHRPVKPENISPKDSYKIPIAEHIADMRAKKLIPSPTELVRHEDEDEIYGTVPAMLAVPISDLVANLLRPCFHRVGLGSHRLFYLEGEPINERTYFCICFFGEEGYEKGLQFRQVRFDSEKDRVFDNNSKDKDDLLNKEKLTWAASLVPLVIDGRPLSTVEIAKYDYDLRQIFGRDPAYEPIIDYIHAGGFSEWDKRVEQEVLKHEKNNMPFEKFYHSILAVDRSNDLHIRQVEGTLPVLAKELAGEGMTAAGILDSGGSCALYDIWMASYLNHGWYFREPRGSILVFELTSLLRTPKDEADFWIHQRGE